MKFIRETFTRKQTISLAIATFMLGTIAGSILLKIALVLAVIVAAAYGVLLLVSKTK